MTVDVRNRPRHRLGWLFLLGFTLLLYPLLLMGSSQFGSSVGLGRDVNASRALARALSYAADPRHPVEPGNDGQLPTAALDGNLVALQLGDGGRGSTSLQARSGGPGSSSPAPGGGSDPTANPGGGGVVPAPPPTAGPSPTAPPVVPSPTPTPSPSPSPSPSPTPCSAIPPVGLGVFDGRVLDPQGNKESGATVRLYWHNCLVGTPAITGPDGKFAIPLLAAKTTYSYFISAPGRPTSGPFIFTTDGLGNHREDPQFP